MNPLLISFCSSIFLRGLCVLLSQVFLFSYFFNQVSNVQTQAGPVVDLDNMSYEVGFQKTSGNILAQPVKEIDDAHVRIFKGLHGLSSSIVCKLCILLEHQLKL